MKRINTDHLLTLGMALTTDRKTMERRVRGVFARKKSAKGIVALAWMLALALGLGAFTTACQPGQDTEGFQPIPVGQTTADDSMATSSADSSATHLTQPTQTLSGGVQLVVDADVTIPQTEGFSIRECTLDTFTMDDYRTLLDYFSTGVNWTPDSTNEHSKDSVVVDLSNADLEVMTYLSAEQNGKKRYAVLGDRSRTFLFLGSNGIQYSEGLLLGDEELNREFGDIIRAPIDLTQQAAQAQADQVLKDLNMQGLQLYGVQRAGLFDENNTNNVLSRGWQFLYGLANDGLSVHQNKGYSHNKNDRLSYWSVYAGGIAIYVDENGVSQFDCDKRYQPSDVTYPVDEIISADEALKLASERIIRLYDAYESDDTKIEIYSIRLGSTLIGYSDKLTGQPFPEVYEDIALLIPTWDVLFREVYSSEEIQYFTMPFCAVDGGAVSMVEQ